jgi:hypothetical protein
MKLSHLTLLVGTALLTQPLAGAGVSIASSNGDSRAVTPMLPPAATPAFHPAAGTYPKAQSVTITDATSGATIYYTTNGKTPSTASIKYKTAIAVSATETIKAIAVATGHTQSAVATAIYTIETPAATPEFKPKAGTYLSAQSVAISDATSGATIYYTTNGKTPTASSTKYKAAITVSATETIKAIAVASGHTVSAEATALYTIETPAATPVITPKAGTYLKAQSVTIADATKGATIYYTTNGKTPTTSSAKYSGPITVSTNETIKAIATASGHTQSALATAAYIIEVPAAAPVISPMGGKFTTAQMVTITDTTPGAVIYYTTNGTVPSASSTKYTGSITVSATETIEAIATAPGFDPSPVVSVSFTITPATEYTIGGMVSGLSGGSLILVDNGTDNLTVTSNGAFTFKTSLANGAAYSVTVGTPQPAGLTCTVANGSGTVMSADVTNVAVTCAPSTTGGGPSPFWIPFVASPVSGAADGQTGLFVIASNAIAAATAPTPAFVANTAPTLLGFAFQGFVSGGGTTYQTPAVLIYAAPDMAGNQHIYGLDLTDTSKVPAPKELTSLSVAPPQHICAVGQLETDLTMADSLAAIVYETAGTPGAMPGTTGYCNSGTGTYYAVPYSAGMTDDPSKYMITLPGATADNSAITNDGEPSALYLSSGALSGIELWDAANGNVLFYTDDTFTTSTTMQTSVPTPVACVNINAVLNGVKDSVGGRLLVAEVTTSGEVASGASYQLTAAGEAEQFFAGDAASCITDTSNLFFIGAPSGTATYAIYQEPVAATPPAQMLLSIPAPTLFTGQSLIGSDGTDLFLESTSISETGLSTSIEYVPEGTLSASATNIAGPYSGEVTSVFLAPASSPANDLIIVNELNVTGSPATESWEGFALSTTGTAKLTSPNAYLASFGTFTTELAGNLLELSGITDTTGTYGGGTFNQLDVSTLMATPLLAGGTAYAIPAGYLSSVSGFFGTSIAAGTMAAGSDAPLPSIGFAIDVSQHAILPITIKDTNVATWF